VIDDYLREGTNVSPLDSLSLRERDVLTARGRGRTNAAIAQRCRCRQDGGNLPRTHHEKAQGQGHVELVKFSMRHGSSANIRG